MLWVFREAFSCVGSVLTAKWLLHCASDGEVVVEYSPQPLERPFCRLILILTAEWLWSTLHNHLSVILAALLHF